MVTVWVISSVCRLLDIIMSWKENLDIIHLVSNYSQKYKWSGLFSKKIHNNFPKLFLYWFQNFSDTHKTYILYCVETGKGWFLKSQLQYPTTSHKGTTHVGQQWDWIGYFCDGAGKGKKRCKGKVYPRLSSLCVLALEKK